MFATFRILHVHVITERLMAQCCSSIPCDWSLSISRENRTSLVLKCGELNDSKVFDQTPTPIYQESLQIFLTYHKIVSLEPNIL